MLSNALPGIRTYLTHSHLYQNGLGILNWHPLSWLDVELIVAWLHCFVLLRLKDYVFVAPRHRNARHGVLVRL